MLGRARRPAPAPELVIAVRASLRNLLDDWGSPKWLVNGFSLKSAPALAAGTLLDMPLKWLGRGAILHAEFRRPLVEAGGAS